MHVGYCPCMWVNMHVGACEHVCVHVGEQCACVWVNMYVCVCGVCKHVWVYMGACEHVCAHVSTHICTSQHHDTLPFTRARPIMALMGDD